MVEAGGRTIAKVATRALIFAALYFVVGVATIQLARFGSQVAPIWVGSPILAWALITSRTRDWPIMLGATAIAHVIGGIVTGDVMQVEAMYLIANLCGPIACAGLLRMRGDALAFEDRGEMLRFLVIAGILAPALSTALVAPLSLIDPTRMNLQSAGIWFLADSLSLVVFLPIFRSLAGGGWRDLLAPNVRVRAAIYLSLLVALNVAGFLAPGALHRYYTIILVPYVIFLAYELGESGARAGVLISTVMLLADAMLGPTMLGRSLPPLEYMIGIQLCVGALVVSVLPLAAVLTEKQKLYETASQALNDAQLAWGEIIAAEAHYRLIADNTTEMIMRLDLGGVIRFTSAKCSIFSENTDDLAGRPMASLAEGVESTRLRGVIRSFVLDGAVDKPMAMQLRLRDANGALRVFDARLTLVAPGGRKAEEIIAVLRQAEN